MGELVEAQLQSGGPFLAFGGALGRPGRLGAGRRPDVSPRRPTSRRAARRSVIAGPAAGEKGPPQAKGVWGVPTFAIVETVCTVGTQKTDGLIPFQIPFARLHRFRTQGCPRSA